MELNTYIYGTIVLFCGLAFGSFVTLASYRLPRGEDIVVKPSRCPLCEAKLGFWDLWPVLSWVLSAGKCRHCSAPVSARYPLTELATGAMFLWLFVCFGATSLMLTYALLWVVLMVMIVVDLEHYLIPDEVHMALLPLGLYYHFVMSTPHELVVTGFLVGAGTGLSLHYGYRFLRRKEGLGFGDVKFLALAGLWLGVVPFVPFLFFSGVFGVILGLVWRALGKGAVFPFGPALAAALFLCVTGDRYTKLFWNMGENLGKYIIYM